MAQQQKPPEICECSGEIYVEEYLTIIDGEEFIDVVVTCSDCGELT